MADRVDWHLSNIALSPPTQMARRPLLAPFGPPLTGASRKSIPLSANVAWRDRTTSTAFVERSNQAEPLRKPSIRPLSPVPTFCTSAGVGNEVKTMSQASASARGLSAQGAPAFTCLDAA